MKKNRVFGITRRSFFAGLGSAGGAAIFLRPLIAAAEGAFAKRFAWIHYPVGTVSGLPGEGQGSKWFWLPTGAGPTYTASPLLKLFEDRPADNIYTFVNGPSVRSKILPIDGLDLLDPSQATLGDKHSQAMNIMGTGWMSVPIDNAPVEADPPNAKFITVRKGTKTIDQELMEKVADLTAPLIAGGMGPQFKSLQLCGTAKSMANQGFTCLKVLSYAGNGAPLFGEGRSQIAFNNIFGMAMMPGADPAVLMRQQAQKKSVLDFVITDIQRMQALVPVGQRPKLDAQLTSIRALEARITMEPPPPGMVVRPTLVNEPLTGTTGANADEARHQTLVRNMFDIMRCAFLSDLTRVISITLGDGNHPNRPLMWVPKPSFTNNADHHSVSHSGKLADAINAKGEASATHLGAVADFLKSMNATPEGPAGETLLDHVFGHVFTECRDGDTHERRRNPSMLFGGKFLKLNSGQFMVVSPNRYTNDMMAAILQAFGAPLPNGVYGDPMYGKGALPGIFGA